MMFSSLRQAVRFIKNYQVTRLLGTTTQCCGAFYPVDDDLFGLSLEEKKLRRTAFELAQKELAPKAAQIDTDDEFHEMKGFWKKLADLGFLGIGVSPEYGGSGMGCMEHCLVIEELSRASAAIALNYFAHTKLCTGQINRNGSHAQKEKFLPKLCNGDLLGAMAITEPDAGSDASGITLKGEKQGDHYILNGQKAMITNGPNADLFVVFGKTLTSSSAGSSISAFIVERGTEGFSSGPKLDKLGVRGSHTGDLFFTDCRIPDENVLGNPDKGAYILFSGLDMERLAIAAVPIGLMQAACDVTFDYVHKMKHISTRIGEFQLLQGKIADMCSTLSSCRSYLYTVARAMDRHHSSRKDCAAAYLYCAENATQVCLQATQCLGGSGFISGCHTGRLLRDAKLFEIAAGTKEIRRIVIGRAINSEYR